LVAKAPQLGRQLRWLCYAMQIKPPPALRLPPRPRRKRARKPEQTGVAQGPVEGSGGSGAVSRRAAVSDKPTLAEILSWMPGQKRPLPWSRSPARNNRPLIRPKPKMT
jgi:hypothetical protein